MADIIPELLIPWVCRISRLSTLFMGREMGNIGFGSGQFFLLSELFNEEGLSQDELSRRVGVDKSNTSRALAKLEQYGLVYRRANPENYKEKKVYLRPKALVIRDEFKAIQQQWNEKLLKGFSAAEKRALLTSLIKMAGNAQSSLDAENFQDTSQRKLSIKEKESVGYGIN